MELINGHAPTNDLTSPLSSKHQPLVSAGSSMETINHKQNGHVEKFPNSDYITQGLIDRYMGSKENLSAEQIRLLLRDSRDSILLEYKDQFDVSNSPSFSQLKSPYPLICRERYRLTKKMYERQFQSEIQQIIKQQAKAFDAVCFMRIMAITSLWPPLHTRPNVDHTHQHYFQLTPKQRQRLSYIMRVDWSKT